jgi:hypothetical protein
MLNHSDPRGGESQVRRDRANNAPTDTPALTDREVPLGSGHGNAALHAWLDGEGSMAAAAQADRRQVEFWSRIGAEAEARRQVKTPVHLQEAIMAALPDRAPQAAVDSWWQRPVTMTPAVALAAAAGLLVVGAVLAGSTRDDA